ncbi:MAG: energy-coupling factor ABC transporter ATP-binding protein [Cetobacterium sp.]|uniref:energy-coupling factor ABC transporter ATP-binding protein n=1 Tax=Cetobacterium sp. TaxID=2071632 RepID=UPI003F3E23F0
MFQLKNVEFWYDKNTPILKSINLNIKEKEISIIMGENGSGKSTLLMLLKGINKVSKGDFLFKNEFIRYNKNEKRNLIKNVGYIFQDPDIQLIGPDVESDIEFGPLNLNWNNEKVKSQSQKAMEMCDILHLKTKIPQMLSYGEKRRVAIAGVLAMDPEAIILDEPTTWLDPYQQKKLKEMLIYLKSIGKTIVLSTHDINFAKELNGSYIFIKNGAITRTGDVDLFKDGDLLDSCRLR